MSALTTDCANRIDRIDARDKSLMRDCIVADRLRDALMLGPGEETPALATLMGEDRVRSVAHLDDAGDVYEVEERPARFEMD